MAIARIGSLNDQVVLLAISPVSKKDITALQNMGGLISLIKKSPRRKSSVTRSISPGLAATNDSEVELQRLTLAESRNSVEDGSEGVKLELDAPVPILTTISPRPNPYVLGLKRAGRAMFAPKKTPSVTERSEGQGGQESLRVS
ncbi:hypothetical protein GGP41_000972 [Bipolaris sorokiniana]|uniref:Uncharacterized protein n=1 Tax=Cochliobolus sativus TaxID=45130 RepID=A0A8H5ZNP6_COCSA|nr:hypothetical protein GGP41_000972 [Bipolaris sorokiniana]